MMLSSMVAHTEILKSTRFIKFIPEFLWAYISGPLLEMPRATITAIVGLYNSSSVRWVRGKLYELIIWLRGVTATEWLTFLAVLIFWPVILLIYIVQSITSLLKVSDPLFSAIIEPLISLLLLISPDDIEISNQITY